MNLIQWMETGLLLVLVALACSCAAHRHQTDRPQSQPVPITATKPIPVQPACCADGPKWNIAFLADYDVDWTALAQRIHEGRDPVSIRLRSTMEPTAGHFLNRLQLRRPTEAFRAELQGRCNALIAGPNWFDSQLFSQVKLRTVTERLLAHNPEGEQMRRLNRLLLEDAYPGVVRRNICLERDAVPNQGGPWVAGPNGKREARVFRFIPAAIEYHGTLYRAFMIDVIIRIKDDNVPADYYRALMSCESVQYLKRGLAESQGVLSICATDVTDAPAADKNSDGHSELAVGRCLVGCPLMPGVSVSR